MFFRTISLVMYLRAMFQPGIAWPHLAMALVLVAASILAAKLKLAPVLWQIALATCAGVCVLIPVVGNFQASRILEDVPPDRLELVPAWLNMRWDQPVLFCVYAALLVCLLAFRKLTGLPSAPLLPVRYAAVAGVLLCNAPFLAAPLVCGTTLRLAVMSPDKQPLSKPSLIYRSHLTGYERSLVGDTTGSIQVLLLWQDTIDGDVRCPGRLPDHLYISERGHVPESGAPGDLSILHNYPATPEMPRVRQISCLVDRGSVLPVYLPAERRLEPLPYQDVYVPSKYLIDHHPTVDRSITGDQ